MNIQFINNLKELRKIRGVSQDSLAESLGLTRTTIINYEKGVSEPGMELLLKMSKHLNIQVGQLISGKITDEASIKPFSPTDFTDSSKSGEQINVVSDNLVVYEVKPVPQEEFQEVPVLSIYAQAGYLNGLGTESEEAKLDTMLIPKEYDKGHYLVVEVKGDSMNDGSPRAILEKDKVLAKELPKELWRNKLHYNHVWCIVTTDGITFKEIVKHNVTSGIITCHSWNKAYKDYEVNLRNVYKLFYVKKLVERYFKF